MVSYIHAGVFVPVFNYVEGYELVSFASSANPAVRLQYWDENAYVSELTIAEPDEEKAGSGSETQQKAVTDAAAAAAASEGLVAVGDEADAKSKKRKAEAKTEPKQKKVRCVFARVQAFTKKLDRASPSSILEQ